MNRVGFMMVNILEKARKLIEKQRFNHRFRMKEICRNKVEFEK